MKKQAAFFGYRPAFILYTDGAKNAAATPDIMPELPGTDGTILYNVDTLREQLETANTPETRIELLRLLEMRSLLAQYMTRSVAHTLIYGDSAESGIPGRRAELSRNVRNGLMFFGDTDSCERPMLQALRCYRHSV